MNPLEGTGLYKTNVKNQILHKNNNKNLLVYDAQQVRFQKDFLSVIIVLTVA